MPNVTTRPAIRTAIQLASDDGTVATVRRRQGANVLGLTPRWRMYDLEITPRDQHRAHVTVSRPLLKQLLRAGTRITGRAV